MSATVPYYAFVVAQTSDVLKKVFVQVSAVTSDEAQQEIRRLLEDEYPQFENFAVGVPMGFEPGRDIWDVVNASNIDIDEVIKFPY